MFRYTLNGLWIQSELFKAKLIKVHLLLGRMSNRIHAKKNVARTDNVGKTSPFE